MHATRTTDPVLRPLYCVDGGHREDEEELALPGYRGSAPVRVGNAAATQLQLDVYGPLFEEAWSFHRATGSLGAATGRELAALASFVAREWRRADAGIWESRDGPADYVLSKAMCWTALDRALKLADADALPLREEWRPNADWLREWVETSGWDDARGAYFCVPGDDRVDASLLLLALCAYAQPTDPRFLGTLERVRAELGHGPFVYRFSGSEELEGAFVACSFWLVDALARAGRRDEAAELMDELVEAANDVGLYAEEIDPHTGEFLGNLPQGLVHLALVNAAVSLAGAGS
jgi:GH15 family glucan-1,4-alpha-glucosidase